jgi:hypothetical protein
MAGRNGTQLVARVLRAQQEEGTVPVQDLRRAEAQYYEFRTRLEGALAGSNIQGFDPRGVYGAERELRSKLGLASTDGRLIRPIDAPTIASVDFDWFESLTQSLYNSPEVRRSKFRLKQRELELIAARNQILPELNLSLTGRLVGVGDELGLGSRNGDNFPIVGDGTSAWAGLTEGSFGEFGARIEFTPTPIGQRRELARINNAQKEIIKEKAFIEQQELQLNHLLADAMAKLQTHYRQIQSSAQRMATAEDVVRIRQDGYMELEEENVNFLLDSVLQLANAQIAYYRSLCEYNKSISYVHYIKGSLLEYNNITLAEGPWPEKAYWDALERARERSAGYEYRYGVAEPRVVRTGEFVQVNPQLLPPHGSADEVILGHQGLDETLYEGQPTPAPMEPIPPGAAVESMEELEMPVAPGLGPAAANVRSPQSDVQQAIGSGLRPSNQKASFEVASPEESNRPQVTRKPLPNS